jgi:hypothetical protein
VYLDCFLAGSWMLTFGWFLGAIYAQRDNEKVERQRRNEIRRLSTESETQRSPVAAPTSADCEMNETADQRSAFHVF